MIIADLDRVISAADRLTEPHALDSYYHGPRHWRDVVRIGTALGEHVDGVDKQVVFCFGLLHDRCRLNDDKDPEHGPRAAELTETLIRAQLLRLSISQQIKLIEALNIHTGSGPVSDPTIGTCLDADRLTLWRCAMTPKPEFMSTELGRLPMTRDWSRQLIDGDDVDWDELWNAVVRGQAVDSVFA